MQNSEKNVAFIWLLVILWLVASASSGSFCREGNGLYRNEHCYFTNPSLTPSFAEARAYCESNDYRLAEINSLDEYHRLQKTFGQTFSYRQFSKFFVAASSWGHDSVFQWLYSGKVADTSIDLSCQKMFMHQGCQATTGFAMCEIEDYSIRLSGVDSRVNSGVLEIAQRGVWAKACWQEGEAHHMAKLTCLQLGFREGYELDRVGASPAAAEEEEEEPQQQAVVTWSVYCSGLEDSLSQCNVSQSPAPCSEFTKITCSMEDCNRGQRRGYFYKGDCYYLSDLLAVSQAKASHYCQQMDLGRLVEVPSLQVANFLRDVVGRQPHDTASRDYWTAGVRGQAGWQWAGSRDWLVPSLWASAETVQGDHFQCSALTASANHYLTAAHCDQRHGFICQVSLQADDTECLNAGEDSAPCICPLDNKDSANCIYHRLTSFTQALSLNGESEVSFVKAVPTLTSFTACFWMRSTDTAGWGAPFAYYDLRPPSPDTISLMLDNYNSLALHVSSVWGRPSNVSATDGLWHHLCVSWTQQSAGWNLYRDAQATPSLGPLQAPQGVQGGGALFLGRRNAWSDFVGDLLQFNLWDRELSESHVLFVMKECAWEPGSAHLWGNVINWNTSIRVNNTQSTVVDLCTTQETQTQTVELGQGGKHLWTRVGGGETGQGEGHLTSFSACTWMRSRDVENAGTIFSYSTEQDREAVLFLDYNSFELCIGGACSLDTTTSATDGLWHHICITWTNQGGFWALYKDGSKVTYNGYFLSKGTVVPTQGLLVLGYSYGPYALLRGGQQSPAFVGQMAYFEFWDWVIDFQPIVKMAAECYEPSGSLVSWQLDTFWTRATGGDGGGGPALPTSRFDACDAVAHPGDTLPSDPPSAERAVSASFLTILVIFLFLLLLPVAVFLLLHHRRPRCCGSAPSGSSWYGRIHRPSHSRCRCHGSTAGAGATPRGQLAAISFQALPTVEEPPPTYSVVTSDPDPGGAGPESPRLGGGHFCLPSPPPSYRTFPSPPPSYCTYDSDLEAVGGGGVAGPAAATRSRSYLSTQSNQYSMEVAVSSEYGSEDETTV